MILVKGELHLFTADEKKKLPRNEGCIQSQISTNIRE